MRTRLAWKLLPSYLLVIAIAAAGVAWTATRMLHATREQDIETQMLSLARMQAERLAASANRSDPATVNAWCGAADRASGYRFTVIRPDGVVIGDSRGIIEQMDNHGDRPEIREALEGKDGHRVRYSPTLRRQMAYLALPVRVDGEIVLVVRVAAEAARLSESLRVLNRGLLAGAGITVLLAVGVSVLVARRIGHPLAAVERGVQSLVAGNLERPIPQLDIREIDELSATVNWMAEQLGERIDTVTRQRDEQEALLTCMAEGVIAVDRNQRIIVLNRAAEEALGVTDSGIEGRGLAEIIRNADLHRLVEAALGTQGPVEGEIYLPEGDRYLHVSGRTLKGPGPVPRGAVLVMNDVTRLRRLETMRRDFVANVSHELKTPVTTIKGFAETLLDGELHDAETQRRFLEKIARQADRLHRLIEDILSLSRMEYAADRGEIELASGHVAPVVHGAIRACQAAAHGKQITLTGTCPDGLLAQINAPILEQAVINLIDNAIKYGGDGKAIRVVAERMDRGCCIRVTDEGPGIARQHWERLFERFYRVDQGRSRELGGTGLGLAIVKHAAIAHRGRVEVQSELGRGSTFTIILP